MKAIPFGQLPTGETIEAYDLLLPDHSGLRVITLGGIIQSLQVPDREGARNDVVLGFDNLADYVRPHPYFGAIAGRVAGRISNAQFTLAGKAYALAANDPPNHLHGGHGGFSRRVWEATPLERKDQAPSLRLEYHSPDGEDGYPGNLDVAVTYTFSARHELIVEYEAISDQSTPLSLTQHSYFNLAGEGTQSVLKHRIQIFANDYAPANDRMGLLGERRPVHATGNDLRIARLLGDVVPHLHQRHGDLYFVPSPRRASAGLTRVAHVEEPSTGRTLTVTTDEPCLQFYTGVSLDNTNIGKSGLPYGPFAGFCLECEGYPDGPNTPDLGDIILHPGQTYRRTTVYAFGTTSS
ncbi:MAG: galactose mutarotase [Synoicihabitans sp.]